MRMIEIKTTDRGGSSQLVCPKYITGIKIINGHACLMMNGDFVSTRFKTVKAAFEYIQQAEDYKTGESQ